MEPGWIYVLVNSSMPGLAKVGRTTRPPAERVAELSSVTSVATPFVLAFDQPTADCGAAERAVHAELDRRGWRFAPNREFFRGPPSEIVRVVLEVAGAAGAIPASADLVARTRSGHALLRAGDRCLNGLGEMLQDTGEAIRLYRLAAARGVVPAYERLGRIYVELYVSRRDRTTRRRALTPLKQGAKQGDSYCYAEMATLFAVERHLGNFAKAWALFFDSQTGTDMNTRLASACCRYVSTCLALGLEPIKNHVVEAASRAMVALLTAELEVSRDKPRKSQIAQTLRWVVLHCSWPDTAPPAVVPPAMPARRLETQAVCWHERETLTA